MPCRKALVQIHLNSQKATWARVRQQDRGGMASGKQYGLILPKSKGGSGLSAPSNKPKARGGVASAFGEDDSSSEGTYLFFKASVLHFLELRSLIFDSLLRISFLYQLGPCFIRILCFLGEEMCTDWMKKKLESTNQPKKKPSAETAEDEAAR